MIQLNGGFDHNSVWMERAFRKFGEAFEPESGRVMEVWSDLPGVQLYTFNSVEGLVGKDGNSMKPHTAFCLETQFYPDSVHHENFPLPVSGAGDALCHQDGVSFFCKIMDTGAAWVKPGTGPFSNGSHGKKEAFALKKEKSCGAVCTGKVKPVWKCC